MKRNRAFAVLLALTIGASVLFGGCGKQTAGNEPTTVDTRREPIVLADSFALPKLPGKRKWYYVTNTGEDTFLPEEEPLKNQTIIRVPGGTLTILVGK